MSTHQGCEFLADAFKGTETIVLGEGVEEVLEDIGLVATGNLLELLDDLLLVGIGKGRSVEDGSQLLVALQGLTKRSNGLRGLVEGSGLGRSGEL